jgi:quercetin dioxygenase-like cupin family protein
MKIVSIHEAAREPFIHSVFTGPNVTRQELAPDSREFTVNMVNFGKGMRNKFHAHDSEQILIVIAGEGIVATESEEHTVSQGDVIFIPAGEAHWHGATSNAEFSHIFVQRKNSVLTQIEK